ncbi:uncharacterized protein [Pocillopora verrucosa]|uniref:uncharacterized protein n=1 Tax=Pocillopora verrucosa TaxID=203993 RepID=UPI002796EBAA|nr:uncharacterized protein LOC131799006 [Pocillopora verrucosa]
MQRIRRNAFTSDKREEAMAMPEPPPQFSHETVTFGMVSSSAEDFPHELSERDAPCPSLTEQQITAFREVFDLFDSNGGGTIDAEELDLALRSVEIYLSQEDLLEVLSAMDKDGNGEIDFHEFLNLMTNTERFLEGFTTVDEKRKREHLLFEALTQFMKRSALHSISEIVGFYHTKYKRIQAPHVVGHYAAGARVIGLTENQLRRRMESLKARHAAGDNKSPYAEPLHIVFGTVARKKCPQRRAKTNPITETDGLPEISLTKGKIRLKFGRPRMPPPSSSYPNILEKSPVLPNASIIQQTMSPAAQLLMRGRQTYHQGKRKQRKPPLKKNGWVSQRFKPFPLELPSIFAEREKKTGKPEQHPSLTFDDLKKIRDKVAQARDVHFQRLRETKSKDSEDHWKSLAPEQINSDVLRDYFRLAFNTYTPYATVHAV